MKPPRNAPQPRRNLDPVQTSAADPPDPAGELSLAPSPARRRRHAWLKLAIHKYICMECGLGRTNIQERGRWMVRWSTPDGDDLVQPHRPPCAPGTLTAQRLSWLVNRGREVGG